MYVLDELNHQILYNRLSLEEERLILRAVHLANRENATLQKIITSYERLAGKTISTNLLIEKLGQAEEAGLVEAYASDLAGELYISWKSRIPLT